jgi:hypothetical protein
MSLTGERRSDTPLIYKAVPSWFVAVEKIKDRLEENNKKTYWYACIQSNPPSSMKSRTEPFQGSGVREGAPLRELASRCTRLGRQPQQVLRFTLVFSRS